MDNHQMIKHTSQDFKSSTPLPKPALAWLNRINPQCGPTTQDRRCWWSPRIPPDTRFLWSSHTLSKRRSRMLALLAWHRPAPFSLCVSGGGRYTLPRLALVWVVEGKRQLEIGANVECEELGCVVGGPFKPNKHREVRGLVWRPWINKPSGMTMRCADISHHTALSSKHTPPRTPLLCPMCSLTSPLSTAILSLAWSFFFSHHTFIFFHFAFHSSSLPPSSTPEVSIRPLHVSPATLTIHPSVHPCMHGWACVRGSACAIGRGTEPLWHWAVTLQPRRPGFRPTKFIYRGEKLWDCSQMHFFSFFLSQGTRRTDLASKTQVFSRSAGKGKNLFFVTERHNDKKLRIKPDLIWSSQLFTIGGFSRLVGFLKQFCW